MTLLRNTTTTPGAQAGSKLSSLDRTQLLTRPRVANRRRIVYSYLCLTVGMHHERCRKADYGGFDQGTGDPAQGDPAAAPLGCGHAAGGGGHTRRRAAQARPAVPGDEVQRLLWVASP